MTDKYGYGLARSEYVFFAVLCYLGTIFISLGALFDRDFFSIQQYLIWFAELLYLGVILPLVAPMAVFWTIGAIRFKRWFPEDVE